MTIATSLANMYLLVGGAFLLASVNGRASLYVFAAAMTIAINVPLAKSISLGGVLIPFGVVPFCFVYLAIDLSVETGGVRSGYAIAVASAVV